MAPRELGAVLKAALVAALVAALAAAVFHFAFTERVIQQAIDLEEKLRGAGHEEEEVVSRSGQRAGLFLGFLMYGVAVGLLFAGVYFLVQRWLSRIGSGRLGLLLALAGYWSVALFPFLKYPANPPGVGDADTIYYRQQLYLGLIGLSLVGAALAFATERLLARFGSSQLGPGWRLLFVLTLYGGYLAVVFLAVPDNPDPVPISMNLVWKFRALSLTGLTLFWLVLGALSGLLLSRQAAPLPAEGTVRRAAPVKAPKE